MARRVQMFLVALLGLITLTSGYTGEPTITLTLGTATKGGGFQLYGQALADALNASDPGLQIDTVSTRGSTQNLQLLEAGKLELGLVEGNAARAALEGIERPASNLKVLSVMYPNPGMFVVRADSGYHSITDLQGKPIAFGTRASGLRILAYDVLDGLGLHPERDFEAVILEQAGDGPRLVLENKVAALWGAGIGWPGFVKVADSPAGGRFIAPTAQQIEHIRSRHPHLKPMAVPAGTYAGQTTTINSVGLWSLVLVRPDVDTQTIYRLTRTLHRSESALGKRLTQGRYTTAQNTIEQVTRDQLHPGALRYYQEAGLLP